MSDVDALTLQLLPHRVRDCGVHGAPANLVFAPAEWPALDCIAGALRNRQPFVARYIGNTMDSGTETVFIGTRERIYRIYKDTAGPFTIEQCSYATVQIVAERGVVCTQWTLVRDLRKASESRASTPLYRLPTTSLNALGLMERQH
jgi:hypothetical protein